jgi:hypothetical protein
MAVLTRDEFFDSVHRYIGEDSSDEGIAFLEDVTDTYNSLEERANGNGEDWEARYHELDETWKERYKHRFQSSNGGSYIDPIEDEEDEEEEEKAKKISIDDLFE